MKRYVRLALGALCMFFVMFLSAAITLRIALHGHEVAVPNFSGMTVAEASTAALQAGVDLNVENKFYSTTIPAGRMLSQSPAPGSKVRHGWKVRVTASLGPQQVTIPDVVGMPLRQASIEVRRMSLDLGAIAHIDAPGDPEIVLAQTPPPNAGVDQPRVSLLLSSQATGASSALVMPSFTGLSYSAATHAAAALGLHVASAGAASDNPSSTPAPPVVASITPDGVKLDANGQAIAFSVNAPPPAPVSPTGNVLAQKPDSGDRISKGDTIHLTFGHTSTPPPTN